MSVSNRGSVSAADRVRLEKTCRCYSTSSGPRVLIRESTYGQDPRKDAGDTYSAMVVFVLLACDACDAPWIEERPKDAK